MTSPLPRSFYDRPALEVARDLLGCYLVRRIDDSLLVGKIVETEAYIGPEDLACHASKGVTPRTEVLFGPPGHAYVYLIYGMHNLFNVVVEDPGVGAAVLVRALEPVRGLAQQEGASGPPHLREPRTDGPGRLAKALAIDRGLNKWDLTQGEQLWVSASDRPAGPIETGPRIGVDYAGEWAAKPFRLWLRGNPWISLRPRRDRKAVVEASSAQRTRRKDRLDGP